MNKFNAEDRRLARILSTLIWATWSVYLVVIFTSLFYNQDWKLMAVTLAGGALLSAAMVLMRRGHLRASSLLVVLGTLGTITVIATVGQGIRDLAIVAFPIVFIFAGLTLNRALFRLCIGLTLAAVGWLVLGEIYGWFVPTPFVGEMANWLYLICTVIILLVAALAVELLATNMRTSLELAHQEISQRKQMESNLRIIAEVQDILLHPCELKDIYRLVSEKVEELIGDGITATAILDERQKTLRMGSYHGVDIPFEKVLSVIGFDPWQKEFPLDAMTEEDLSIYYNSKLGILEGGLYALMTRLVSKPACLTIEKLLRVQKIYGMGFVHKDAHLGGLVILARNDITPHVAAIEHIVHLATIAIERKRAEDEVKNRERRFQALIAHGRDEISLLSADGTLLWESPSVHSTLGYAPNQFIGGNIFALMHPDDQAWTSAIYTQVVQSPGSVQEGEFRLMHADGMWRWIECSAANLLDELGVQAIVLNYRDITERKRLEEAIKQSEAKYRKIVETTNEGVIVLDHEARMTLINPQMAAMLGYTTEELLTRKLESLLFEDDWGDHQTQMQARAQGQSAVYERCFRHKDGSRLWTLISATATTDAEGRFDGAFGMITDITERKQAEEKIRAALEEKETLLREVHHRVKNNLQVIISLIKMRARSAQEAGTVQFLTELEGQAHTMALVYEQLYQSENLAQVNMAQYLRQLTANVLDTYGRRDAIQFRLDAPLALDVAQATPCGLIVNELFSNILKYAFPPGFQGIPTVSITLWQEDEIYHLTVNDNGVGFPSGYDWRAGQSMGLRLVNLWVTHQLGGTLAVSGKPGTTFAIAFDLKG